MMDYACRRRRLRARMREAGLDGFLALEPANVSYLSGFRGESAWLLISARAAVLFTDFRFREQAAREAGPAVRVREVRGEGLAAAAAAVCRQASLRRLGLEGETISRSSWRALASARGKRFLRPVGDWVGEARMVKDADEIERIARSARLSVRVLSGALGVLRPGMTEAELAAEIVFRIRKEGGREAFDPIVAFGPHASEPHAIPGRRPIRGRGILLIDLGAALDGYHSDLTRTYFVNAPDRRFAVVAAAVGEAQRAAIAAIAPGAKASAVDEAARSVLRRGGWEKRFGHSLGHGVGLQIHEGPRLNGSSKAILEEGMVVTVEPGVYLPGWGGVRIEDTVLVTRRGGRVLTRTEQENQRYSWIIRTGIMLTRGRK